MSTEQEVPTQAELQELDPALRRAVQAEMDLALRRLGEVFPNARSADVLVIFLTIVAAKMQFHLGSRFAATALSGAAVIGASIVVQEDNAPRH